MSQPAGGPAQVTTKSGPNKKWNEIISQADASAYHTTLREFETWYKKAMVTIRRHLKRISHQYHLDDDTPKDYELELSLTKFDDMLKCPQKRYNTV
jgi:hypothetical protein